MERKKINMATLPTRKKASTKKNDLAHKNPGGVTTLFSRVVTGYDTKRRRINSNGKPWHPNMYMALPGLQCLQQSALLQGHNLRYTNNRSWTGFCRYHRWMDKLCPACLCVSNKIIIQMNSKVGHLVIVYQSCWRSTINLCKTFSILFTLSFCLQEVLKPVRQKDSSTWKPEAEEGVLKHSRCLNALASHMHRPMHVWEAAASRGTEKLKSSIRVL